MMRDDYPSLAAEVQRAQAGELAAFRSLVVRFQDMAVGYAFSLLGDHHLAEDAAQEAFLAVYRKLGTLRHPEAFVTWLRSVLFKQCDRIRRARPITEPLAADDEGLVADGVDPVEALADAEMAEHVGRAIGRLSPGQRQVVSLYYIGEQSGPQVAAFLDLPLTTVKKRLHDAKPKLRKRMSVMAQQFLENHRPSRDAEFADRVLRLAAPDPFKDTPAICSLFEAEDHPARSDWRAGRLADSHADWRVSRAAFARAGDAEQLVAALNAYDLTMRIGSAEVRVAGINGDVLHGDLTAQRDAILARMATASIASMREAGYDLAVTFDDEAFWQRRGFALGWQALSWRVDVVDLPPTDAPALERIDAAYRDDLAAVHNTAHEGLTGTVRRPTYRRNKHPGLFTTHCWRDDGKVAGYISVDAEPSNSRLWVDEVAGDAEACLAALRKVAEAEGCGELFFDRLHYRSKVGVRLRRMGSCRLATGTRLDRPRWYLVRIVDLESTMTKLAPMLRERLLASELATWRGTLGIRLRGDDATETVTLAVKDDGIEVRKARALDANAIAGGQALARLLLGAEDAAEVVAVDGIDATGDAARLLPVLFPTQHPQMENQAL